MRYRKNVSCSLWDHEKRVDAFRGLVKNVLILLKSVNIITIFPLNKEIQTGHWNSEKY